MNHITMIGLIAGALTSSSFIPQIHKIYCTRQTRDLSLPMFSILTLGIFLWIVYGLLSKSMPVVVSNVFAFSLCMYIVTMKLRYG